MSEPRAVALGSRGRSRNCHPVAQLLSIRCRVTLGDGSGEVLSGRAAVAQLVAVVGPPIPYGAVRLPCRETGGAGRIDRPTNLNGGSCGNPRTVSGGWEAIGWVDGDDRESVGHNSAYLANTAIAAWLVEISPEQRGGADHEAASGRHGTGGQSTRIGDDDAGDVRRLQAELSVTVISQFDSAA